MLDWDRDYKTATVTDEKFPNYRVTLQRDEYPEAPDWDFQAAVIRVEGSYGRNDVEGQNSEGRDFEDALRHFVVTYGMSDGLTIFERFVTIFHDATDVRRIHGSYNRDYVEYVVFATRAMLEKWGCAEEYGPEAAKGTADDWQSYLDGEVYVLTVERREQAHTVRTFEGETVADEEDEVWTDLDTVGGYYGDEYAEQAAREMLTQYAE